MEGTSALLQYVTDLFGSGLQPLHIAAMAGNPSIVRRLLASSEVGAVNAADDEGRTPMMFAAREGHCDVLRVLCAAPGMDANAIDKEGRSAVIYACIYGQLKALRILEEVTGINMGIIDNHGYGGIMYAAVMDNCDIVEVLVRTRSVDSEQATIALICTENVKVVQHLLSVRGVDVNGPPGTHRSALNLAAERGDTEMVRLLLRIPDIRVNTVNEWRNTPLMLASAGGHGDIVDLLLEHKETRIDAVNVEGETALIMAAGMKRARVVRSLLSRTSTSLLNHVDVYGRTALMWACRFNYDDGEESSTASFDLVLTDGIDVSVKDNDGHTALFYACCSAAGPGGRVIQCLMGLADISDTYMLFYGRVAFRYWNTAYFLDIARERAEEVRLTRGVDSEVIDYVVTRLPGDLFSELCNEYLLG